MKSSKAVHRLCRKTIFLLIPLVAACSSIPSGNVPTTVANVQSLTSAPNDHCGKWLRLEVVAIPSKHGILMADARDSNKGVPISISDRVARQRDVAAFLGTARRSWLGEDVTVKATFTGTLVCTNEKSPHWEFELSSIQDAQELVNPATPQ